MKKYIILTICLLLFNLNLFAKKSVKLYFHEDIVANAHTALLFLEAEDIKNPKLTFLKLNIAFTKDKKVPNRYFALIPIDYYTEPKRYKVITSFEKKGEKEFKGIFLTVVDAGYKSEILTVQPSKIHLNEKDKKRAQREYKEAMGVYNKTSNYLETSFVKPLNSAITSDFGNKRLYNSAIKGFHSGTDFKAAMKTPIKASAKGVVKVAKHRFYAGNSVIIDHGSGLFSCYYHLSKISVKKGQTVSQNELIGYSGNTGRVTGPHLHFSIRLKNKLVDPLQFIEVVNTLN